MCCFGGEVEELSEVSKEVSLKTSAFSFAPLCSQFFLSVLATTIIGSLSALNLFYILLSSIYWGGRRGPVVRALGVHAVVPGSSCVLTSSQDLFPVHTLYGAA